jgi:HAD superfamily hydrolase (TIGR01450 family)
MDNPFLAPHEHPGNVVLDLDGVVFLGSEAIPGAGAALQRLADCGWRVLFATNNATRSLTTITDRISKQTGFVPDPGLVVTSAIAACELIGEEDQPVHPVGEQGLRDTLTAAGIRLTANATDARTVIVALDREFSYDTLREASGAIRSGARFIATNTDVTFPTPDGQVPGAGSIVAAVVAAAGSDPEIAGKPYGPMISAVSQRLGAGETWMIGDRPETDLAFARAAGWRSVLTLSGVTSDPNDVPERWRPDLVADSLPELVQ